MASRCGCGTPKSLATDPSPHDEHPIAPDISNLRSAAATDGYTLRGDADGETWEPRFTFHGFRYCEVSWQSGDDDDDHHRLDPLTRDSLTGLVMANDLPATGTFETDHGLLDRLHENIGWGLLGNFLEVPTDCPQRDERLGWTGDIQVFAPTASFHRDVSGFLRKWMRDVWDAQLPEGDPEAGGVPCVVPNVLSQADGGPGWSDAAVDVPSPPSGPTATATPSPRAGTAPAAGSTSSGGPAATASATRPRTACSTASATGSPSTATSRRRSARSRPSR